MSAKYGQYYSPAITAAKGVKTWPVWVTAILAIMPTSLEELQQNWPAVVVLLVATLQPMVQNWWKHSDKPPVPLWVILAPLLGLLATGCAHSGIRLSETMSDGSSSNLNISTMSTIGKQDALQNFSYQGDGENPWKLKAGQEVHQDTTDVLDSLKQLLSIAQQLAPLYAPPPPAPVLVDETPDE